MLALLTSSDEHDGIPIHHARLAEGLELPRATVKRNLARLAEDGFPVERTPQGWRATLSDHAKLDTAVAFLLSERSRWGELLSSPFPKVLPDPYLRYRLEMLLDKVLTSEAVRARITPDAVRAFVAVSDSVPPDGLVREEMPKAVFETIRSARDAPELRDRLRARFGGTVAHIELPPKLIEACLPMLRRSPTLLQASLDPQPFGFARARLEDPRSEDGSEKDFVPGLLTTVCTAIYDADSLLTLEPERPPAGDRPSPDRRGVEGRVSPARLLTFARRLSRRPAPPGRLVAKASLRADEIQQLASRVPDLVADTEGLEFLFRLRIELSGDSPPPRELVERTNRILKKVNDTLELR
jgi:biotin operon repressor